MDYIYYVLETIVFTLFIMWALEIHTEKKRLDDDEYVL